MADQDYFLPGEYIGDMHYGLAHIESKVEERKGGGIVDCRIAQFEIHSPEQREALENFLDATRALTGDRRGYLNKMLVAVDERVGAYVYDGRYFGFVTF